MFSSYGRSCHHVARLLLTVIEPWRAGVDNHFIHHTYHTFHKLQVFWQESLYDGFAFLLENLQDDFPTSLPHSSQQVEDYGTD